MTIDIAIVEQDDTLVLHTATCPVARQAADDGLMTMIDCQKMPGPDDFPELVPHTCLTKEAP